MELSQIKKNFIEGAGSIAVALLGILNRVCGQIYALLYLSPNPLSLDDIVEELGVSKGSVSINIRILEDYKLVKKVWVKGSRKDFYEALDTLPKKIIKEFIDKMRRNVKDSLDMITDCCTQANHLKKNGKPQETSEADFVAKRLKRIQDFYTNANLLFDSIYEGAQLDARLLKPILDE